MAFGTLATPASLTDWEGRHVPGTGLWPEGAGPAGRPGRGRRGGHGTCVPRRSGRSSRSTRRGPGEGGREGEGAGAAAPRHRRPGRAPATTRGLERALRAQGRPVELFPCEKVEHGFLAYARPTYDPRAAVTA